MSGQGIERREMMRILAFASSAAAFPGFQNWAFACDHFNAASEAAQPRRTPYQPQFCSQDEYAMVERLSELIIPTDDKPGAHGAGVSEFIDFWVWSG